MTRGHAVGIDFGTTNSVVAHGTVATAGVLSGPSGDPLLPSVVSLTDDGALVGREATERAAERPAETVAGIKRHLGEEHTGVTAPDGTEYTPEQIAALVFSRLRGRAEAALEGPVTDAVVTVPAYFGHRQRTAVRRAAEIAGLDVRRLLSEPTAACLAYGVGAADGSEAELVLVYDLGGGTFDVSLVDVSGGVYDVLASKGDTRLGGNDWDDRIIEWYRSQLDSSATETPRTSARLRKLAKRARHDLTHHESTTVELPALGMNDPAEATLTRETLDDLTGDLVERTLDICDDVLASAGRNPWSIDRLLLVGGATRMPQIREAVYDFFGDVPSEDVDPDQVVATGAAIQASIIHDGPETNDEQDAVMVDVAPRPLGVETMVDDEAGYFSPVIEAQTSIPASRTRHYRTVRDDQRSVSVRVYSGEAERVADNEYLGSFVLRGLPKAPAGEVGVDVTFTVTENGLLEVEAAENETGRAVDVTIESPFDGPDGEVRKAREQLPALEHADA
ncbi:Hsp70 family protein [Haloglomus salinum]|uniref:Hsp70 family protein n=1 Tax=Haloglomus salinum TaxID=2962673 RepID=UPI0020C9B458|nr:Hsp70 family protein [Haloglomus salinum]